MQMILIRGICGKAEMNLADTYPVDKKVFKQVQAILKLTGFWQKGVSSQYPVIFLMRYTMLLV
jgi:hypothetical protein